MGHPKRRSRKSTTKSKPPVKTELLRQLLVDKGLPAREAAIQAGVTPRWVFQFAARYDLPTNPPIPQGSVTESKLCRNLVRVMAPYLASKSRKDPLRFSVDMASLASHYNYSPKGFENLVLSLSSR
jgi:hypothetical protein